MCLGLPLSASTPLSISVRFHRSPISVSLSSAVSLTPSATKATSVRNLQIKTKAAAQHKGRMQNWLSLCSCGFPYLNGIPTAAATAEIVEAAAIAAAALAAAVRVAKRQESICPHCMHNIPSQHSCKSTS